MLIGGIEAGGTKFVYGIADESGCIIERFSCPTQSPAVTLAILLEYFKGKKISALGIGSFGPIDPNIDSATFGYILKTPKLAWADTDFAGFFKRGLNLPVGFDTDVNGAALGEVIWGAAKGLKNAVYLTVGTGIGGGAVVNGALLHGALHPEMGHIAVPIHPEDKFSGVCPFHKSCLEGMASGPSIEMRWGVSGGALGVSHKAWEIEAHYLAEALCNYILILAPERIILGGGVMAQEQLFPKVRAAVKQKLAGYFQAKQIADLDSYIVPPLLGDNAGFLGAVAIGLDAANK